MKDMSGRVSLKPFALCNVGGDDDDKLNQTTELK